jgi:hypothetical protein
VTAKSTRAKPRVTLAEPVSLVVGTGPAYVTVYNVTDTSVTVDTAGHRVGGYEYGTVVDATIQLTTALANGRLVPVTDPGGDLTTSGLSPAAQTTIVATRTANGGSTPPLAPAPIPVSSFSDTWVANTQYPANTLVLQAGAVYLALPTGAPARSTFTAGDWKLLVPAASPKPSAGLDGKPVQWNNTTGQFVDDTARQSATLVALDDVGTVVQAALPRYASVAAAQTGLANNEFADGDLIIITGP